MISRPINVTVHSMPINTKSAFFFFLINQSHLFKSLCHT